MYILYAFEQHFDSWLFFDTLSHILHVYNPTNNGSEEQSHKSTTDKNTKVKTIILYFLVRSFNETNWRNVLVFDYVSVEGKAIPLNVEVYNQ